MGVDRSLSVVNTIRMKARAEPNTSEIKEVFSYSLASLASESL
jgi:hypothetical protein